MKVSVLVTTYNHEKFIAQAIDSVLAQEATFDYEVVIGEDCSTDSTRDIVLAFRKRYPDKIRLLLPHENLGFCGNVIFERALKACQGQFVALLDGDDYWTSPHKLQRQVDFLEDHPECAICFHDVAQIREDGSPGDWDYTPPGKKKISSFEDLLPRNFIGTCSAVFRTGLYGELPDWFHKIALSDWFFHILIAQYGKIGYIDEVMGVHRVHSGGVWSRRSYSHMFEGEIEFYKYINAYLDFRYDEIISAEVSKRYHRLVMAQKPAELKAQLEQGREGGTYRQLVCRIREVVRTTLPPDARVLVVSKGDDDLLKLDGREGWHFPRVEGGGPEQLFAEGSNGSEEANWIDNGKTYEFRLYAGMERTTLLDTVRVARRSGEEEGKAFLVAAPNPVPAGEGLLGTTTISWSTGQEGSWGRVYVSVDTDYYPADSAVAIDYLEEVRTKGAEFLLFPATGLWWFEHYPEFRRYLASNYRVVGHQEDACLIFDLRDE
jgi:glycosyltransferase involved in cell wall biosynthesis